MNESLLGDLGGLGALMSQGLTQCRELLNIWGWQGEREGIFGLRFPRHNM